MKTKLHHYYFMIDKPSDAKAYDDMCKQLNISHAGKFFNVLADLRKHTSNTTEEVELDPSFLFNNQWNELDGKNRRLFEWYEGIYPNRCIKLGHWLEITPEMQAIREETLTCGYCGKYVPAREPHKWHCEKCLGSEYLKEKDLDLLRLQPVARKNPSFDMTEDERASILPLYKEAQGLGMIARDVATKSKNRSKGEK